MVSTALIVVIVLIIAIWGFIEFKRFRHKIWAILLIVLILFAYFSFASVVKSNDINIKTFDGIKEAGKLYGLWFVHAFQNMKMIVTGAVHMDWKGNETNKTIIK